MAKFPAAQRLSQHIHLVIAVRNAGTKTIPDVAVTLTNPNAGTSAQAFGELLTQSVTQPLASLSRPVWVVDRPPEPPPSAATDYSSCGYSCQAGGAGGAVTAYSDTWALGSLRPGATATFDWAVTPVKSGTFVVRYEIAAGLNGKARAVLASGARPIGQFRVTVAQKPSQAYVNDQGQVVTTK